MLDAFRDLLRELNKFQTPTIDPGDFTYFMNSAIDEYITKNYGEGDVTQKNLDDMRVLFSERQVEFTQDGTDKTKFAFPGDYFHILDVEVRAKVLPDKYRRWKKNDVVPFSLRRQRTNRKGFSMRNAYDEPSEDNPQYSIIGNNIYALVGSNFEPTKLYAWYLKKPATVVLGPVDSDYNDENFNSTLQFPDSVVREIVKHCKTIILENQESQRLQSSLALQQLRKE